MPCAVLGATAPRAGTGEASLGSGCHVSATLRGMLVAPSMHRGDAPLGLSCPAVPCQWGLPVQARCRGSTHRPRARISATPAAKSATLVAHGVATPAAVPYQYTSAPERRPALEPLLRRVFAQRAGPVLSLQTDSLAVLAPDCVAHLSNSAQLSGVPKSNIASMPSCRLSTLCL